MEIKIDDVVVGKRVRKDMGDMDKLVSSMKELGLLTPIGIDENNSLVFGGRRLAAAQILGWKTIEAKIIDCDKLIAERDENDTHKHFTYTERIAIAAALDARLSERHGTNQYAERGESRPALSTPDGKTANLVGPMVGFSGKTYERVKNVVNNGAPELVEAMDKKLITPYAAVDLVGLPLEVQKSIDYADKPTLKKFISEVRSASGDPEISNERREKKRNKAIRQAEGVTGCVVKPDESRLYSSGSLSALALAHRAKTAITQINKNDPKALAAIESIQAALNNHRNIIIGE